MYFFTTSERQEILLKNARLGLLMEREIFSNNIVSLYQRLPNWTVIMNLISSSLLSILAGTIFAVGLAFTILSLIEKESRAALRAFLSTLALSGLILSGNLLDPPGQRIVLIALLGVLLAGIVLFVLPIGRAQSEHRHPARQVDEREIIFARTRLEPGTGKYLQYYQAHPEHQKPDDAARSQPGLLSPDARFTEPFPSAAAAGSFALTEALRDGVDGPQADVKQSCSPESFTRTIKNLARYYGALDCGIALLQPGQIYSHVGRGSGTYGEPIELDHQYGIAFTVEMDFQMTAAAPYPPITMESGRQYVESARVAVQLAAAIRELGYPARAHIDGNYRVIAPLIAREAGLGEIGRMGLLMTPRLGPRVRLGVVTTDLPLIPDGYQPDESVLDFCRICKKCAENCPSQSIPHGDRELSNGVLRWKITPESCYHYWTVVGTDCGKCLAVCPFSHPDNWAHNLVRRGIRHSGAFRQAALLLDDFFYGKKPPSRNRSVLQ